MAYLYIYGSTGPSCYCCAGTPPTGPLCWLVIPGPPGAPPFPDYATAAAEVSNANVLADCLAYGSGDLTNVSSFSATFNGTTLTISGTLITPTSGWGPTLFSVAALGGETLSISASTSSNVVNVYDSDGTLLESIEQAGTITTSAFPADGVYYISVFPNNPPPGSSFSSVSVTVTCSGTWWVNPALAAWDDSGTTRYLEACPKLYLPPLTEATGDWYADETAAADVLASVFVSNCVGYAEDVDTFDTFSATDGGTSLTLGWTSSGLVNVRGWGSLNLESGETLTVTWSATTSGTPSGDFSIYDYDGNLIESLSGASPLTSAALPYTGRYIVLGDISTTGGPAMTDATAVFTSSGTLSVNPIQALYDVGLTCPARLDCT